MKLLWSLLRDRIFTMKDKKKLTAEEIELLDQYDDNGGDQDDLPLEVRRKLEDL